MQSLLLSHLTEQSPLKYVATDTFAYACTCAPGNAIQSFTLGTATVQSIIFTAPVQLSIHSLEKQKVARIRKLIILVSVCVIHAIAHV